MSRQALLVALWTSLIFFTSSLVMSAVPGIISYQGRLTASDGSPVTNGTYQVRFTVYDGATGGTEVWSSGLQPITVTNGLFEYGLGSHVPLPNDLFANDTSRYLGIRVGSDPELTPRTRLVTTAYAYHALRADSLDGTSAQGFVHTVGDTMTGPLLWQNGQDSIVISPSTLDVTQHKNGKLKAQLSSQFDYGSLFLYSENASPSRDVYLSAKGTSSGGELVLMNEGVVSSTIALMSGYAGDWSVQVPEGALNCDELFNEPGIAANANTGTVSLTTTMQDLVTVTLTTPTAGYILLYGKTMARLKGTTGNNGVRVQIDQTAGGTAAPPYYVYAGAEEFGSASVYYYYPIFISNVYYLTAGTHTFRLEGQSAVAGMSNDCFHPVLQAIFFASSYGSVSQITADPQDNPNALAVTATSPETGKTETAYRVDLRYYELKAKEARIQAQRAELEAMRAEQELRQAQHRQH